MEHTDPKSPEAEYSERDVEIPEEFSEVFTRCLEELKESRNYQGKKLILKKYVLLQNPS